LNSHVSYLKSGPQCLGRKEFNAEKETILITAGVEKPQYKRKETRSGKEEDIHRETLKETKEEGKRRHKRGTKNKGKKI